MALQCMTAFLALASPPALRLLAQQAAGGSAFKSVALREAAFAMGDHDCRNTCSAVSATMIITDSSSG